MIEIKHKKTGKVLFNVHADTLKGADLAGANLSGADLMWANLTDANLSGADLMWANLTDATPKKKSVLELAKENGFDLSRVRDQREIVDAMTGKRMQED